MNTRPISPGWRRLSIPESLELPFWMFKFDELADVVFSNRQPHPDERDALYEVIRIARAKYQAELGSLAGASAVRRQPIAEGSSVTSDAPTPYRIIDVVAIIEEWLGMLDQRFPRSDLRALRHRLRGAEPRSPLSVHVRQAGGRGRPCQSDFSPLSYPDPGAACYDRPAGWLAQRSHKLGRVCAGATRLRDRLLVLR